MKTFKQVYDDMIDKEIYETMRYANHKTGRDIAEDIWNYQQRKIVILESEVAELKKLTYSPTMSGGLTYKELYEQLKKLKDYTGTLIECDTCAVQEHCDLYMDLKDNWKENKLVEIDKSVLLEFINDGLSVSYIAGFYGCSRQTVRNRLKSFEIRN